MLCNAPPGACHSMHCIIRINRIHTYFLSTFSTNATGKLDILRHNGHTLGMDGTKVGILKKSNQVCLSSLLESQYGGGLETKISLEVLSNLTHKTLEGCLADQEVGGLLILADLTKGYSSRTITVGLLHSSCGGCGFTCSLWNARK